jgi:hypothetical protein
MKPLSALRKLFGNADRSTQLLAEIREGVANMTDVISRSRPSGGGQANGRSEQLLLEIRDGVENLAASINHLRSELAEGLGRPAPQVLAQLDPNPSADEGGAAAGHGSLNGQSRRGEGIPQPPRTQE